MYSPKFSIEPTVFSYTLNYPTAKTIIFGPYTTGAHSHTYTIANTPAIFTGTSLIISPSIPAHCGHKSFYFELCDLNNTGRYTFSIFIISQFPCFEPSLEDQ